MTARLLGVVAMTMVTVGSAAASMSVDAPIADVNAAAIQTAARHDIAAQDSATNLRLDLSGPFAWMAELGSAKLGPDSSAPVESSHASVMRIDVVPQSIWARAWGVIRAALSTLLHSLLERVSA